jgi:hypothetical protein
MKRTCLTSSPSRNWLTWSFRIVRIRHFCLRCSFPRKSRYLINPGAIDETDFGRR